MQSFVLMACIERAVPDPMDLGDLVTRATDAVWSEPTVDRLRAADVYRLGAAHVLDNELLHQRG